MKLIYSWDIIFITNINFLVERTIRRALEVAWGRGDILFIILEENLQTQNL